MATKGYIVFNITQKDEAIFKSQVEAFIDAFKQSNANLIPIDNLHALETIQNEHDVNFILFWDKDIALMYSLMNLKIPLFNNIDAIRLCDDKAFTYAMLMKKKIATPKTIVLPLTFNKNLNQYFNEINSLLTINKISYPLIVKERCSSLGLGVYLINNELELKDLLNDKYDKALLIQEYINYEYGQDYRVYLVNHRVKAIVTRINKKDFRSNLEQGGEMFNIPNPSPSLLRIAIRASLAVKLDFGAVDIVKDKNNKYYVLEVNSNARTLTLDSITKQNITKSVAEYILENI